MGEACGRPAAAVHRACSNNHPLLGAEQADFVHADSTTATEADVITLGRRVLIIGLALALPLARPAAAQRRADAEPSLPPVNTLATHRGGITPRPSAQTSQISTAAHRDLPTLTYRPLTIWGPTLNRRRGAAGEAPRGSNAPAPPKSAPFPSPEALSQ